MEFLFFTVRFKYKVFLLEVTMKLTEEQEDNLVQRAKFMRPNAYVPNSGYKVGAALMSINRIIYDGVNVENAIQRTTHAERQALDEAVKAGEREFVAIAVVTEDIDTPPCGQCLADLCEFDIYGDGRLIIIAEDLEGHREKYTLAELLPKRFGPMNLGKDPRDY